jgi:hypothetical protein
MKNRCSENKNLPSCANVSNNSIIGGLFGLECTPQPQELTPPFLTGRDVFLANARSGIWLLVNQLQPLHVWVPSYLCHTIIGAINLNITELRFYDVDYDLTVRSNEWVSEVASGDLVIFIDYFGYPHDHLLSARVKEKGAQVMEDASQALLSCHVGANSDFVLFSPRKYIGVPDGGILRVPESFPMRDISLEMPPTAWWLKALQTVILRREFDDGLPSREWFRLFREAEDATPIGPYAMTQLSRTILEYSVDYSLIAQRRIDNYCTLLERLAAYALFPRIETDVVPLGFPVYVANRDAVRQTLFDHEIYPPLHWEIENVVPPEYEESHRLSRQIMTLPCDQRYGTKDMERIADVFLQSSPRHK